MLARHEQDAQQKVDDLIRAVPDHDTLRRDLVPASEGGREARVAALRIAEAQRGGALHGLADQRGRAQGVLVAGHLDDLRQTVFFLDFGNGSAGDVGLQAEDGLSNGGCVHLGSHEHFPFGTPCIPNHRACRFTEKRAVFRSRRAGGAAPSHVLPFQEQARMRREKADKKRARPQRSRPGKAMAILLRRSDGWSAPAWWRS